MLIEPVPLVPVADLGAVHFIAIGGAGMSGVAAMYARLGVPVTGSDQADSATLAELRAHVSGQLADYKAPDELVIVDELPLTPMLKLDRRALTQMVPAGTGQR